MKRRLVLEKEISYGVKKEEVKRIGARLMGPEIQLSKWLVDQAHRSGATEGIGSENLD